LVGILLGYLIGLQGPAAGAEPVAADAGSDGLADGRALTALFLAGDVEPVWERFGQQLRAAVGSAAGLKGFSEQIGQQLGTEERVLREGVELEGGLAVYRRIGTWSKAPMPIAIIWAVAPEGTIEGFQVAPAPPEALADPAAGLSPMQQGQLPDEAAIAERLAAFVAQPGTAPGVIAAVRDRDGTRFVARGDAGDGRPPDADTVFEAGSIAKGLTGLLLAQMIATGEVAADQPIDGLVPAGADLATELAAITLESLATHRSGLPRLASGPEMQARMTSDDPYGGSTPAEIFADVARVSPEALLASRGRFGYSNLGVALLGQLLAQEAGQPYEMLLTERVFAPLGLEAPVLAPDLVVGRQAVGHQAGKPVPAWRMDAYAPMGAWQASARDLVALGERLLRAEPEWVAAALVPRDVEGHPGTGMGLGWHHSRVGDRAIVWHNGGTAGSSSFLAIVPAEGLVVAVLANGGGGIADGLARSLLVSGR
jgi:CubicO group peptidase (beta-lactamase class C family)